jgi:hypothetical protein
LLLLLLLLQGFQALVILEFHACFCALSWVCSSSEEVLLPEYMLCKSAQKHVRVL